MSEIRVTEEHREKAAAIVQASFFHGVAHADIATVLATALAERDKTIAGNLTVVRDLLTLNGNLTDERDALKAELATAKAQGAQEQREKDAALFDARAEKFEADEAIYEAQGWVQNAAYVASEAKRARECAKAIRESTP